MKKVDFRVLKGIGLIALGTIFLLQTTGIISGALSLIWSLLFAAGGAVFLYFYFLNRTQWWALIPGMTLLGVAGLIILSEYGPFNLQGFGASLLLFSIAVSFLLIYLLHRSNWWAIIPGGFLASTATMVAFAPYLRGGEAAVGVFFFGGALTFGLLSVLQTPQGRMKWAYFPGIVLLVFSLVFFSIALEAFQAVWAGALIVLGLIMVLRTFIRRENA